jgi:hypothetical protein
VWIRRTESERIGLIQQKCTKCNQTANFLLYKRKAKGLAVAVPYWYTAGYYATCGSCHTTFKLDKTRGKQLEQKLKGATRETLSSAPTPDASMSKQFCINCSKPLSEGAKFCAICGAAQA